MESLDPFMGLVHFLKANYYAFSFEFDDTPETRRRCALNIVLQENAYFRERHADRRQHNAQEEADWRANHGDIPIPWALDFRYSLTPSQRAQADVAG